MKPVRIQLSRKKGFKLPPNTINVARPTKWGNPFKVTDNVGLQVSDWKYCDSRSSAVSNFRLMAAGVWSSLLNCYPTKEQIRKELRGKNLACWCPLPAPGKPDVCHASILLEIANS